MDTSPEKTGLTNNQKEELKRRIKYGEENPEEMVPWEKVYEKLMDKYDA